MSFGKVSFGKVSFGKVSFGKMSGHHDNNNKSLFSSALMENGVLITNSLDKARIFNYFLLHEPIWTGQIIDFLHKS